MAATLEQIVEEEPLMLKGSPGAEQPAFGPAPERVLIVRLGSMGDIVHTLPSVGTLRRAWPKTRIGWVIEERWAELLCSGAEFRERPRGPEKPLVDDLHVVHTREWRD